MAFGFFDPQKGQTATGIAQSRAMAAALLRSGGAPRNVGEGLNSIGDAIFYRSLIGDADASEKTQTDAFNSSFNSLIAPYAGGGQASAVPMAAGEVSATAPASGGVAAALMANDGSELGKYLSDDGLRSKLPAGMRNNNPGNIKFVGQKVPGIVGPSVNTDQGDPQAVFDTPENGMRAMYSLLGKKYAGGKMTPNQLIAGNMGWTPGNYDAAANVARYAGIGPDDDIGFTDPARASRFMQGLITQEHGKAGAMYPLAMIQSAIGGNTQVASATPVTATDAIEAVAPQPGYRDPQVTTAYANPAPATASAPPLPAPTTVSAAPAVAEAAPLAVPQQVAQNFQPRQIDPRLIEAANSPFATPGQKAILGGIIQQQQQRNELLLKQQLQQGDPSYQIGLEKSQIELNKLKNPGEPADIQELRIRAKEAGIQPGTPEYQALFASGGKTPLVTVNNGDNSGAFGKKSDEEAATRLGAIVSEGNAAPQLIGDLQQLADLGKQIGTGKGAEVMAAIGPYAQAVGVDVKGLDETQAFKAIVNRLAPQMRPVGSGPTSDFDARQFLSSLPSLGNQPGGNELISQTFQAVQQNKIAAAEIASKAQTGEIKWQEAERQIRSLPNPYEVFKKNRENLGQANTGENPLPPTPSPQGQRPRAVNPQTNQVIEFDGKGWVPVQ